jgi:hypothetical protein
VVWEEEIKTDRLPKLEIFMTLDGQLEWQATPKIQFSRPNWLEWCTIANFYSCLITRKNWLNSLFKWQQREVFVSFYELEISEWPFLGRSQFVASFSVTFFRGENEKISRENRSNFFQMFQWLQHRIKQFMACSFLIVCCGVRFASHLHSSTVYVHSPQSKPGIGQHRSM